jgi:hypothetical protein
VHSNQQTVGRKENVTSFTRKFNQKENEAGITDHGDAVHVIHMDPSPEKEPQQDQAVADKQRQQAYQWLKTRGTRDHYRPQQTSSQRPGSQ